MNGYTDGFYEIEFQRVFREQGRILYRMRNFEKQLNCYMNKMAELEADGICSPKLISRIDLVQGRLDKVYAVRNQIEAYKDELSINNPENVGRVAESKIISDAYERAYTSVDIEPVKKSMWNTVRQLVCFRQK